jgi:hypothetical protein
VQRSALPIGTKIVAEDIDTAVMVFVAGVGDMRRDQHPAIRPEKRHWWALKFADIDVERRTTQMTALKSVEKGFLIDDLAAGRR